MGRVDLALSRSFLSAAENRRVINLWGPGAHPVADLHYHGTHVGSTVASNGWISAGVTSGVTRDERGGAIRRRPAPLSAFPPAKRAAHLPSRSRRMVLGIAHQVVRTALVPCAADSLCRSASFFKKR